MFLLYGLLGILLLFKMSQGPFLAPDSQGYLSLSPHRSLLYPLFLHGCQFLFGGINYGVVLMQFALGTWGILHFTTTLRRSFEIAFGVVVSMLILLVLPYFWQHLGNYVLTEALCYPLFLFLLSYLVAYLKKDQPKDFYKALGIALVLTLTRSQFIFLWPAFVIVAVYQGYHYKKLKIVLSRFCLVLLVAVMAQGIERSYNYALTGTFKGVPFVGRQFVVLPLYLSDPADEVLFDKPEEKEFFQGVSVKMDSENLRSVGWQSRNVVTTFEDVYNLICHQTVGAFGPLLSSNPFEQDAQLLSMGLTLAKHHWQDYAKFYLSTLRIGFGGYCMTFVFGVLGLLCFFYAVSRRSFIQEVFLLCLMMHLGNTMLVALFEPLLSRYMIYTALPLWSMVMILMAQSLLPKREA